MEQTPPSTQIGGQPIIWKWKVINDAPPNIRERKNLEALIIAIKRPVLDEQED